MSNQLLDLTIAKNITIGPLLPLVGFKGRASITIVDLSKLRQEFADKGEEEILVQKYLNVKEQEIFHKYAYPKRRIEWLGGRLAAKYAALELMAGQSETGGKSGRNIIVLPNSNGRPFLQYEGLISQKLIPDISISHSGDSASAMAVINGRCGMDIQKITSSIHKVKDRFVLSSEQDVLDKIVMAGSELTHLTMLWAAKESIKKVVGTEILPGFLDIRLKTAKHNIDNYYGEFFVFDFICHQTDNEECKVFEDKRKVSVIVFFQDEAILAFTAKSYDG